MGRYWIKELQDVISIPKDVNNVSLINDVNFKSNQQLKTV